MKKIKKILTVNLGTDFILLKFVLFLIIATVVNLALVIIIKPMIHLV